MESHKILVVDDEPDLREILQCNLENAGYTVDTAESAEEALHKLQPDHSLILLDVMLGGMSGFSAGGDDYISKPFSLHEVLARIKAVLRRTESEPNRTVLQAGNLTIDFTKKIVVAGGTELRFSPKEFGILSMLAKQPGRVFSRDEILAEVWHGDSYVLDRTVDVHIARVRRKLEGDAYHIVNRQGYGYCFEE